MAISTTLFAPSIRAVQPAFVYSNGVGICTVYFTLNYNSTDDVKAIRYTLIDPNKSALNGLNSMITTTDKYLSLARNDDSLNLTTTEQSFNITFNLTDFKKLTVNQFYQLQIELQDNDDDWSAPSQVSLIRPIDEISSKTLIVAPEGKEFTLTIEYAKGSTIETITSYSYQLKGSDGKMVYQENDLKNYSGLTVHHQIPYSLEERKSYILDVSAKTKHGYVITDIGLQIITVMGPALSKEALITLEPSTPQNPNPYCNLEAGSLDFRFTLNGTLKSRTLFIERADEFSNYAKWQRVTTFETDSNTALGEDYIIEWRDTTVQSRTRYKYRLVAYTDTSSTYTEFSVGSEPVQTIFMVDYNDIFLCDPISMLAVRYNPKITNYRWVTQDSITSTLGGKYPIIRRNGQQKYRSFTLSGTLYLDSCGASKNNYCSVSDISMDQFFKEDECSFYLTAAEADKYARDIRKRRVLAKRLRELAVGFLSNGSIKLFRSGEEDTMIVYLSGVSFTPNPTSGRHIYDFTATVTEIADATEENMIAYGFEDIINIEYLFKYILYSKDTVAINNEEEAYRLFKAYVNANDIISIDEDGQDNKLKIYAKVVMTT